MKTLLISALLLTNVTAMAAPGSFKENDYRPVGCALNLEDYMVLKTLFCLNKIIHAPEYRTDSSKDTELTKACIGDQDYSTISPNPFVQAAAKKASAIQAQILRLASPVDQLIAKMNTSPRILACRIHVLTDYTRRVDATVSLLHWLNGQDIDKSNPSTAPVITNREELVQSGMYEVRLLDSTRLLWNHKPSTYSTFRAETAFTGEKQDGIASRIVETVHMRGERPSDNFTAEERANMLYSAEVADGLTASTRRAAPFGANTDRSSMERNRPMIGTNAEVQKEAASLNRCLPQNGFSQSTSAFASSLLTKKCRDAESVRHFTGTRKNEASRSLFSEIPAPKEGNDLGEETFEVLNAEIFHAIGVNWRPSVSYQMMMQVFDQDRLRQAFPNVRELNQVFADFNFFTGARENNDIHEPLSGDPLTPAEERKMAKARAERDAVVKRMFSNGRLVRLISTLKGIYAVEAAANEKRAEVIELVGGEFPKEMSCLMAAVVGLTISSVDDLESAKKDQIMSLVRRITTNLSYVPQSYCGKETAQLKARIDAGIRSGLQNPEFIKMLKTLVARNGSQKFEPLQ